MRIIAGQFGGRLIQSPRGHRTHPMSEKARGGLFGALGDISGLTILDAFAGSGALGLEALSRGARSVVAVENDPSAQVAITANVVSLGLSSKYKLIKASLAGWQRTSSAGLFDVVLADPPYDDLQEATVAGLVKCLAEQGILVLSWPGSRPAPVLPGMQEVALKKYGDAQLAFYRHLS